MVTFVVSLFLPYTIDFHEFDDEHKASLKRVPSSRSISTVDLQALAKLAKVTSFLQDINFPEPSPSYFPSTTNLMDYFHTVSSSVVESTGPSSWVRTDIWVGDRMDPELIDDEHLGGPQTPTTPLNSLPHFISASNFKTISPTHSRTSSSLPPVRDSSPSGSDDSFLEDPLNLFPEFDDTNWTIESAIMVNGGLVNAIRQSTEGKDTDTVWIGSLEGEGTDRITAQRKVDIANKLASKYNAQVIYVPDADLKGHYENFCKIILWPILHYHMPTKLSCKVYEDRSWDCYRSVNRQFADKVIANYKQGDTIWVHDYHLMLVPAMIRERLPDAEIGFFFHTAFPSSEIFRCAFTRVQLLEGVLGASMIGLQNAEYVGHFLQSCSRVLLAETKLNGVYHHGRFVEVVHEAVGIVHESLDYEREQNLGAVNEYLRHTQETYKDATLVVARDKLDTVRGIRQKLLAYELFLSLNPNLSKKVTLVQIATSTTELVELHASVSDIVQRITDKYSTIDHSVLEFFPQDMPHSSYVALISAADVLLTTSLREGMGLTAQEFIYCQDGKISNKKHGVVILSEFTGTSHLFGNEDLKCNPWDIRGTAEQIKMAVLMSPEERAERWQKLRDVIELHTGGIWWSDMQSRLRKAHIRHLSRCQYNTPRLDPDQLLASYTAAQQRLFLLDNEGTLVSTPTSPDRHNKVCNLLKILTADPANTVYVTSALTPPEIEALYGHIPKLGLVAENGHFTHSPQGDEGTWTEVDSNAHIRKWKTAVKSSLKYYLERVEGAVLIERWASLRIDYSAANYPNAAAIIIGELLAHINQTCRGLRIHASPVGDRVVAIEGVTFDKSSALIKEWNETEGRDVPFELVVVAGNDRDDEALFRWAQSLETKDPEPEVVTISLGGQLTDAKATLSGGPGALIHTLGKLAQVTLDNLENAARGFLSNESDLESSKGDNSKDDEDSEDEEGGLIMATTRSDC